METKFIETEIGKPLMIFRGYEYRRYRVNKELAMLWVCLLERNKKRRGRLHSKDNDGVVRAIDYDCVYGDTQLDVTKAVYKAKKRETEEDFPIPKVYNELGDLRNRSRIITRPEVTSFLFSTIYT